MIYLGYIVLLFTALQLLNVLCNLLFRVTMAAPVKTTPLLSLIVPVRNEEATIGTLLKDVSEQSYPHVEVIVYDDQSTDNTAEIVRRWSTVDSRIELLSGTELPLGWGGKSHACYRAAQQAKGDYLLFLDADVRIEGDLLSRAIGFSDTHRLTLLTLFPKQEMRSAGEWSVVALMNYILLTLLPLPLVQHSGFASHAAANGQFMLFNGECYRSVQPHEQTKEKLVEDIAIARWLKKRGFRVACLIGEHQVRCRMYRNYRDSIVGLSRSVLQFFGGYWLLGLLFWMVTSFGVVPLLCLFPLGVSVGYLFCSLLIRAMVAVVSKQSVWRSLLYALPQQYNLGLLIAKAIYHQSTHSFQWKERVYS